MSGELLPRGQHKRAMQGVSQSFRNAERLSRRDDDGPVVGFRSGLDVHHVILRDTLVKHADLVDAAHDAPHLGDRFQARPDSVCGALSHCWMPRGLSVVGDLSAPAGHEITANDVVRDGWFVRRSGPISRGDANLLQMVHFYVKPNTHTSDFRVPCVNPLAHFLMRQRSLTNLSLKGENRFAWCSRQNIGPQTLL